MDLDVAFSFVYGLVPAETHKELDNMKEKMRKDPAMAFGILHNVVSSMIIGTEKYPESKREAAVLFYLWGVHAAYASKDPVLQAASKTVTEMVRVTQEAAKAMDKNIETQLKEIINKGKEEMAAKLKAPKSEPLSDGSNVLVGKFKSESN